MPLLPPPPPLLPVRRIQTEEAKSKQEAAVTRLTTVLTALEHFEEVVRGSVVLCVQAIHAVG
jgi:hypothetical protein